MGSTRTKGAAGGKRRNAPAPRAVPASLRDVPALQPSGRVAGLQQALIDAIGQLIMSGEWPAGRQLPPEAALLARFGVSRPTLREALRVLASKGLIESRQKVGTSVCATTAWNFLDPDVLRWLAGSPLGEATARELVGFRRMIEPQVALLAATAADTASIEAVRAAFDDMARNRLDKMAYYMADRRFHQALFAATRNRFVDALGRTVMVVLDFSFSLQSRSLIDPDRGLALHQRVCEAIEARDAAAAEAAMFQLLGEAEVELSRAGR